MNNFYFMLYLGLGFVGYSQVGVNTIFPIGVFHVDGAADNTSTSPTAAMQLNDFYIANTGIIGMGTTSPSTNYRQTIRPSNAINNGIYVDFTAISPVLSSASYALDINSDHFRGRGIQYQNSSNSTTEVFFGMGSILTSTNITSGFLTYRNSSGLTYGLFGITGTTGLYSSNAATWALFSRGRAEISLESSPSNIAGVDLQVRNTVSSSPTTILMRPGNFRSGSTDVLVNLDFGDNRVTTPQAKIQVVRDNASSSTTDLPTAMTFSTTLDGTDTLTERMRISNNGNVGIGNIAGTRTLDVNGDIRVRTVAAAGTPSTVSPRVWASDTNGNLSTLTAAQVVSEGLSSSLNVTAPIAGNGTVATPISLNDLGVTTAKLANNAVTTIKITDANVTTAKIADANVTTAKIADTNVTTAKLADNAVTTIKITDANVTTEKIADANVTTAKLADNAVTTVKITDANVTTAKLADNAVTTAKITDANVTTAKIADANVTTAKLADNAVTTAKITNANVTYAKIQNVAASRLLGNPTGSAVAPSEISLGEGLVFSGTALSQTHIIPILTNNTQNFANTSGAEYAISQTGFLPTLFNSTGDLRVKIVLFINTTAGTTNLQFKAWNNTTDNFFFTTADTWTYTNRGSNNFYVETDWKNVALGTVPLQLSFHTWVSNNSATIKNAYMLVRNQ